MTVMKPLHSTTAARQEFTNRVKLNDKISAIDRDFISEWCRQQFGGVWSVITNPVGTWACWEAYDGHQVFAFKDDRDQMLFMLKWS
jgi:hypothetical protein